MTPELKHRPIESESDIRERSTEVVLAKCPSCGFWTGAVDPQPTCPECDTELVQETFGDMYPF